MLRPIAIATLKRSVIVLYHEIEYSEKDIRHDLRIGTSSNGTDFTLHKKPVILKTKKGGLEKLELCSDFKLSRIHDEYVLNYIRDHTTLVEASSKDLLLFKGTLESKKPRSKIFTLWGEKCLGYYSDYHIFSTLSAGILLSPRRGFFDWAPLYVIGVHTLVSGILVVYGTTTKNIAVGAALFSHKDPHKLIWRSEAPVVEKEMPKEEHWMPFGTIFYKEMIVLYIGNEKGDIIAINLPQVVRSVQMKGQSLTRAKHNPVLSPHPDNTWEDQAVFNPGAVYDNGEVHLLYRAVGSNGLSTVGYAKSPDGLFFNRAHNKPIYVLSTGSFGYDRVFYPSGGGSGGSEDPRAVIIDGRLYMTYVYFGGWDSMRMAMTSISVKDFRNQNWNWTQPKFLSPQGEMHKNWVIFPEKINGKFAVLHGIVPNIMIDYVDDLHKMKIIKSPRLVGPQPGRKNYWDNRIRGAGPPPIKTDLGWLLLYHANDVYDPQRYKLGAMLLDLKDPTKVLYRSSTPILCPDMDYENEGKPGIVYASGAIVKEGHLFIYYGGGDRVVCTATVPIDVLLHDLITGHDIHVETKANLKI
jgi:predicted GH43/DUF377 family glycosyl hydrolase